MNLVDWNIVYNSNSVSEAFDIFLNILYSVIDKSKQNFEDKMPSKSAKLTPWITERLCNGIRRRHKIYKLMITRPYDCKLKE